MSREAIHRIRVNPERTAAVWWDDARISRNAPAAVLPLLEVLGPEEITVTSSEAAAIRSWGASLSGWDEGGPPLLIEQSMVEAEPRPGHRGASELRPEGLRSGAGSGMPAYPDQALHSATPRREGSAASHTNSSVLLPEPRREGDTSIEAALRSRRSIREFEPEPLTLAEASQLLWAAQGETGTGGIRTAPSAGALYPLQLYLVSAAIVGLDAAIYRYDPRRHALHRTRDQDRRAELGVAALQQECVGSAAAILVIATNDRPTLEKYGARAQRYIDIEAGHAAQNVHLQAVALGLGSVDVGAFDDAAVKRTLGLPKAEEPLLLLPVGRKAKGLA